MITALKVALCSVSLASYLLQLKWDDIVPKGRLWVDEKELPPPIQTFKRSSKVSDALSGLPMR